MVKDIDAIISPQTIAVVGATNRPGSVGRAVFSNIPSAGYKGILFPVHPRARSVCGVSPSDIDAIKDCIMRLSQMVTDHPKIAGLDINPLIVYPEGKGCVVKDSRILLSRNRPSIH